MTVKNQMHELLRTCRASATVFVRDIGNGMLEAGHNTLAMVGLAVVALLAFGISQPQLRQQTEDLALDWLRERYEARAEASGDMLASVAEPDGVSRATAANLNDLNRQQALVANWIAKRYHVAPEPIAKLVQEAWAMGQRANLDPTLILAIMAIESSFNPFAQSPVGAQGLMQVMTKVHDEKYTAFGGVHAAFDPVSNVRVGVQVLRECIARHGSLEAGLKAYVGASNMLDDGGYASRVLSEQGFLRKVADGKVVPVTVTIPVPPVQSATPGNATTPAPAEPTPVVPEQVAMEKVALIKN